MHSKFDQILIGNELQVAFNQFGLILIKFIKLIKLKVNIIILTIKIIFANLICYLIYDSKHH